jgi:hypothetical protein
MENVNIKHNVGRRIKLIERHYNGTTSVYTGVLLDESETNYTIKTDRNEERTVSKLFAAIEWLTPAQPQAKPSGVV